MMSPGLQRSLGVWSAAAIVVGIMVGTGIFLTPSVVARTAGTPGWAMAAWVVGGGLSLLGALSYAELGAMSPTAAGDYRAVSNALGGGLGFLYAWRVVVLSGPASYGAIASGAILFLADLVPLDDRPILTWQKVTVTSQQVAATLLILIVVALNAVRVRSAGRLQLLFTGSKVIALLLIIAVGMWWGNWDGASWSAGGLGGWPGARDFSVAVSGVLWSFSGWYMLLWVGGEVRDPERTIPRALLIGFLTAGGLYLLVNIAVFAVLPFPAVLASNSVVSDALAFVLGPGIAAAVTAAMFVSAVGALHGSLLAGARIPYAMAEDGVAPALLGQVGSTTRAPIRALFYPAIITMILTLTGGFRELFTLFVFAEWAFLGVSVVALLRLRRGTPGPRSWMGRVGPVVFVLLSAALTVSLFLASPVRSSLGLLVILGGLPYYWVRKKNLPRRVSAS